MSRRSSRQFRPRFDALQERSLLSAYSLSIFDRFPEPVVTYNPSSKTVNIDGTYLADSARVSVENDEVIVRVTTASGFSGEYDFDLHRDVVATRFLVYRDLAVTSIWFQGHEGDDSFTNQTNIPAVAFGDAGDDTLVGGTNADTLDGGPGDDQVHGENGNDTLFGWTEDDTLYGGSGDDSLYGGDGKDGLFGGTGRDYFQGDGGADRFLSTGEDAIADNNPEDAIVSFVNGSNVTVNIDGIPTYYPGQAWTDADIERLDSALAVLHREARDTVLLKTVSRGTLTFVRQGSNNRGYNDGSVHLTDMQFNNGDNWLRGYVLHEVGHNWQGGAGGNWATFQGYSGWTTADPHSTAYTHTGDWWYLTSSGFASTYARTNPNEDYAESFSGYFMQRAGWSYYNGPGAGAIPGKMAFFQAWVSAA